MWLVLDWHLLLASLTLQPSYGIVWSLQQMLWQRFFLKKTLRKVNDFEFTCFRHCMKCFSYRHKFFVEQLLRWWLAHGFSAVKLFEVMETEQHLFLVMEYASGGKQWRHPKVDIFILSHKLKAIFLLPIVDFDLCLVKQHFLCYIAFGIRIVN